MNPTGCLLIWNDCAVGHEAEYESWYQEEHLPERMAVPGFVCGVRHRALDQQSPHYMTYYEVQDPQVLQRADYLALLEQPTPRTRRIMEVAFKNMNRTVCHLTHVRNGEPTPYVVTATGGARWLDDLPVPESALRVLALRALPRGPATAEEALRGGDTSVEAALVVHVAHPHEAEQLATVLNGRAWQQVAFAVGQHPNPNKG